MSGSAAAVCTICTDFYDENDEIYYISCGHVFHRNCLQIWHQRSSLCPICRVQYADMKRLHLSFDDNVAEESELNELEVKMQSFESKMEKLDDQLKETELNFMRLQEQYTMAQEEIKNLNAELSKRSDSETNFLAIQEQYTEADQIIKTLQEKMEYLSLQIEGKNKEIRLKTMEISALKDTMEDVGTSVVGSDSILNEKLKIMEQKLEHITAELQKEISVSTQLSIDKMKLQSLLDQYGAANLEPSQCVSVTNNNQKQKQVAEERAQTAKKKTLPKDDTHLNSIIIKRFPSRHIHHPLEDVIKVLASTMEVELSTNDILDVRILEHRNRNLRSLNVASLVVQFKFPQLKCDFLNNKVRVRNHPVYNSILIYEYMDDDINSLFRYAKNKLKDCGFNNIYCQNGQVMASKGKKHAQRIHIKSTAQVDDMLTSRSEDKKENVIEELKAGMIRLANDRIPSYPSFKKDASKNERGIKFDEDYYEYFNPDC
uniref:RING-type domain-containing protein n=1 Tax=Glossina brevipalpis TaxID=37001 RepID=A0A1A9WMA2_9MUSC